MEQWISELSRRIEEAARIAAQLHREVAELESSLPCSALRCQESPAEPQDAAGAPLSWREDRRRRLWGGR